MRCRRWRLVQIRWVDRLSCCPALTCGLPGQRNRAPRTDGFSSVGGDFARQRIVFALVQPADAVAVETLLLDLEIGAEQQFRRQFLDGETDGLRRGRKTLVSDRTARLAAAAGK